MNINASLKISCFWRGVSRIGRHFKSRGDFGLGNGEGILFWKDRWARDHSIEVLFPSLYHIAWDPKVKIASQIEWRNGRHFWSPKFRVPLEG